MLLNHILVMFAVSIDLCIFSVGLFPLCYSVSLRIILVNYRVIDLQNVVQRLVEDDSWTQDLADSINRRKEDQSHLAEEKIPEVLDLTKTDPTFTDFHALLTGVLYWLAGL